MIDTTNAMVQLLSNRDVNVSVSVEDTSLKALNFLNSPFLSLLEHHSAVRSNRKDNEYFFILTCIDSLTEQDHLQMFPLFS